jgi:hypothetical protein
MPDDRRISPGLKVAGAAIFLALMAVFVGTYVVAQFRQAEMLVFLQQPRPQQSNQNASEHDAAASQPPPVGKPDTGGGAENQADRIERERLEHIENERGLTAYTKGLAVFTGLLFLVAVLQAGMFVWQLILMNRGVRDAKDAAAGALATATTLEKQFLATNRPKIRIKHVRLTTDIWHEEPIETTIIITNVGTLPARIVQCEFSTVVLRKDRELPFPPREAPVPRGLSMDLLNIGVSAEIVAATDERILTDEEHSDIRSQERFLYCFGRVEYQPEKGDRFHITAFCRRLYLRPQAHVDDRGRFRLHLDPDYEYED